MSVQQKTLKSGLASPKPGDEIVISGMSAKFPSCKNAYEIRENLYKKLDLITGERRWIFENSAMPARVGIIPGAELFDCSPFGLTPHVADLADPVLRFMLENAIETIFDAGLNPEDLAGTRTAMIGSVCNSETGEIWTRENFTEDKHGLLVAARVGANILSHLLKTNGPSIMCDTACSSTAYCLDLAYKMIRKGECDAALIFSSTAVLDPRCTSQFYSLGVLSPDGVCKSFDAAANGYVRSESRCSVFLQKAKDAKRIYGQLVHTKTNCDGYKSEGITFPSGLAQQELLEEVYAECGVDPKDVFFVEAHGTGTKVGDPQELNAIDRVFCKGRKEPLLIGTVKANLGHTEPVAALASLTKILLCMEAGYLAPNIHFNTPRAEVPAFKEGRLKVLLEKYPYNNQNAIIGIGSYGFGGANGHLVLRGFNKKMKKPQKFDGLPRLVCFGGRTEQTIKNFLKDLNEYDSEFIGLLHSAFRKNLAFTHPYRGFAIVTDQKIIKSCCQKQKSCSNELIVVFSGLDNGWLPLGRSLINFPPFRRTLERVNQFFSKNGWDVIKLSNSELADNFLISFVVQIGVIDILKLLGLRVSKTVSVSFGQILADYLQAKISLEDALTVAYCLDKASNNENSFGKISVAELQNELNTRLPKLKINVKTLLHTNLTTLPKLPKEGTILEMGFGRFRATLNGFSTDLQIISFTPETILEALGQLYCYGFELDLAKLYPPVEFPVSRGTPMISPLIEWEHSLKKFKVKQYGISEKDVKKSEISVTIDITNNEWNFVTGHVIDGRCLFPATGYLYVVWKELAALHGLTPEEARVSFEQVRFKRAVTLTPTSVVELIVTIFEGTGYFEVNEGGTDVVTGYVKLIIHEIEAVKLPQVLGLAEGAEFKEQDLYKELKLRGYNYNGLFMGIKRLDQGLTQAQVKWSNNWIAFMDNMLQLSILGLDTRNCYVPIGIDRVVINSVKHMELLETLEPDPLLPVCVYHNISYCRGGYIEISGVKANSIPKRKQLAEPVLEKYVFVPNETGLSVDEALRVNIQIILENNYRTKVKTVEIIDEETEPLSPGVLRVLGDIPLMEPDVNIFTDREFDEIPGVTVVKKKLITETDVFVVLAANILSKPQLLKAALTVTDGGYIISQQTASYDPEILANNNLQVITSYKTENHLQILLHVMEESKNPLIIKIPSTLDTFPWLEPLQNALKSKQNIILLSQNDSNNGILGLFNCIRREYKNTNIRCVFIEGEAPEFSPFVEIYRQQLKKGFVVNIFKDGKWGTYRHLLLGEASAVNSEHAYVNTLNRGDLSTLKWIEGPLKFSDGVETGKELIQVYYASLNFRDVMTATGKLSADVITKFRPDQECVQGIEFAGKDLKGRRVMGMIAGGALSTIITADKSFLIPVPKNWTLEDAATIPVVYGTVLYALRYRSKIRRGQTILIHAGSGGIGQAAIRIALHYGLHVYTTVGTETKRQFIKDTFPQIHDQQIGNSRDTTFEQLILKQTKGKGVDFVLNSLAEEKLQASVRCVAKGGHFLEIGKFDLSVDNALPLKCFARGVSYHGVMLDAFFNQPIWVKHFIVDLIKEGVENGSVQPLKRNVFQKEEIEEAFRFMASGKHIGKVLVELRKEEELPEVTTTKCLARYFCKANCSQVILGGLGGFGLELADWLVLRGAKKLILSSRTGIKNAYQASRIRLWRSYGVDVRVSTTNVATRKGCTELIREANKLGPVESVFNLAAVLQDAVFENQNEQTFTISLQPKAVATTYLDEITRKLCPNLRNFVVFSSVSCGRGNPGQTNYGMANSIMERICEKRKLDGLPALAIQWGAIADVGLVAEMQRGDIEMEIGGTLQQRLTNCLAVLDQFLLRPNDPVVSSMVVAEKRFGGSGADNVVNRVANILGIKDLKTVSLHATLSELGMDSMMAVEIKQIIEMELDVVLSPVELRALSFARLQEMMEDTETIELKNEESVTELHNLIINGLEKQDGNATLVVPLKTTPETKEIIVALPGIEGTCSLLTPLALQLNRNVFCCQYLMDQQNSFEEITEILLKELPDAFNTDNIFRIVCHSFGSSIALKLAEKLESAGKEGKIVFIDGSPDMTSYLGRGLLDGDTYETLEDNFLLAICRNYLPAESTTKVKELFINLGSYEEKLEKLFEILPEDKQHYRQFFLTYMKNAIQRSHAFSSALPQNKIKAQCLLCKARETGISENVLTKDYGLSEFLEKPLEIIELNGTHVTVLENPELAQRINEFL